MTQTFKDKLDLFVWLLPLKLLTSPLILLRVLPRKNLLLLLHLKEETSSFYFFSTRNVFPECVVSSNKLLATSHDVSAVLEEGKNLPHLPPLLPLPPSFLYSIHPLQDLLHRLEANPLPFLQMSLLKNTRVLTLVARFLVKKLNSDVFRKSGQFGVSCPNGSEAIVHYLRSLRFSHPSSRIISVDIRNAFNCVDRIQMLKRQSNSFLIYFLFSFWVIVLLLICSLTIIVFLLLKASVKEILLVPFFTL
ncbi:hypothetical protein GEMRC1_013230 [Eukaryota sp. GEM-RC1]